VIAPSDLDGSGAIRVARACSCGSSRSAPRPAPPPPPTVFWLALAAPGRERSYCTWNGRSETPMFRQPLVAWVAEPQRGRITTASTAPRTTCAPLARPVTRPILARLPLSIRTDARCHNHRMIARAETRHSAARGRDWPPLPPAPASAPSVLRLQYNPRADESRTRLAAIRMHARFSHGRVNHPGQQQARPPHEPPWSLRILWLLGRRARFSLSGNTVGAWFGTVARCLVPTLVDEFPTFPGSPSSARVARSVKTVAVGMTFRSVGRPGRPRQWRLPYEWRVHHLTR